MKVLDLKKPVGELVAEFPELKEVLVEIGFEKLANPMALKTAGKVVTIPKGCSMKGFSLEDVKAKLSTAGFEVVE